MIASSFCRAFYLRMSSDSEELFNTWNSNVNVCELIFSDCTCPLLPSAFVPTSQSRVVGRAEGLSLHLQNSKHLLSASFKDSLQVSELTCKPRPNLTSCPTNTPLMSLVWSRILPSCWTPFVWEVGVPFPWIFVKINWVNTINLWTDALPVESARTMLATVLTSVLVLRFILKYAFVSISNT